MIYILTKVNNDSNKYKICFGISNAQNPNLILSSVFTLKYYSKVELTKRKAGKD